MIQDSVNQLLGSTAILASLGSHLSQEGAQMKIGNVKSKYGAMADDIKNNSTMSDAEKTQELNRIQFEENNALNDVGGKSLFKGTRDLYKTAKRDSSNKTYAGVMNSLRQNKNIEVDPDNDIEEESDPTNPEEQAFGQKLQANIEANMKAMESAKAAGISKVLQTEDFKRLKALLSSRHSKGLKQREALNMLNKKEGGNE